MALLSPSQINVPAKNQHEFFEEILLYLNENKDLFEKNEGHANSIVRVFKRYSDLDKIIHYLNVLNQTLHYEL